MRGLEFDAPYTDTEYWTLISSRIYAQNPLTVGLNQERYREIIIAPFVRDLKRSCRARNLPLRRQWMQQDGATVHMAGELLACLQQHFGDSLISRRTEFPFPSHSTDLMAPDAYTWGMLKESVFRSDDPPGNVPKLREKIVTFCILNQHTQYLKDRYEQCVRREGRYFEHMLYRRI